MRKYTKQQLKKLFSNLKHKRISDTMAHMLIDETYNEEQLLRTSGFYAPGAGDSVMTWDEATRTLLLEPVVPEAEQGETIYDINGDVYVPHFRFYVWERGPVLKRRYAYDAENSVLPNPDEIQIPAEEGLFAIYYDFNQDNRRYELTYTKAPDLDTVYEFYVDKVIVAWVYWDAANSEALYVGDSRHGSEWNPQMHWMLHQTINSRRQSGLALTNVTYDGDGTSNGDYQFGISAGELWHDDIFTGTDAVGEADSLPVWYFNAAGDPRFATSAGKKFLNTGSGRVAFNGVTGGLAEAPDQNFVAYHLFATNCVLYPHISAMGQASHTTLGAAVGSIEAEVATLRQNLPHANLMHIASFVLQTSDAFTNGGKTVIVYTTGDGVGITHVYALPDPVFPIDYLFYTLGGNDFYITDIPKANGLLWGGVVTWITGLTFSVSSAAFYINGVLYTTGWSLVTLGVADDTHPRIDIILVNTDGTVSAIAGTPAANPQKPQPDPLTQIELTQILVPALATEPDGITGVVIYDENVEWTPTFAGMSVNFNSSVDPFNGTICASISNIGTGDSITFTAAAPVQVSDFETLSLFLKLKALMSKQHFLRVQFFLSSVPVSDIVALLPNINTINEWQSIALLLSNFSFSSATFDAVRFDWHKQGAQVDHAGFYMDLIKLEAGIDQPPTGNDGKDGKDGEDGITPHIGPNGNWWIGEADTGVKAEGTDGEPGTPGADGQDGADGTSTYTYVAYASDNSGTGFSLTPTDNLKYRAEIHVTEELDPPAESDFSGATWVKYIGDDGEDGGGGGGSDAPELHLDFEEAGDEFVYNVPYNMKFTSMVSEGSGASLDVPLDTVMARYDRLTITATAGGLVSLYGVYV